MAGSARLSAERRVREGDVKGTLLIQLKEAV